MIFRFLILFTLSFGSLVSLSAQSWDELVNMYYQRTLELLQFHSLLDEKIKEVGTPKTWEEHQEITKLLFLHGLIELDRERMPQADVWLKKADAQLENWITLNPSSEAYRYRVEIRTMLMMTQGLFYTIVNAFSLQEMADKAYLLDPENPRAQMILAMKLIYAPGFLGGDAEKGRNTLKKVEKNPRIDDQGRFISSYTVAQSWQREGQKELALKELDRALSIYPQCFIALKLQEELRKG